MLQSASSALTVLVLIICIAVSTEGNAEPTDFDVGISGNGVTFFTLWMAEAGGFFKNAGLNVRVVDLPGGTRSLQVLLAGKIATHAGSARDTSQQSRRGSPHDRFHEQYDPVHVFFQPE